MKPTTTNTSKITTESANNISAVLTGRLKRLRSAYSKGSIIFGIEPWLVPSRAHSATEQQRARIKMEPDSQKST
jgi:hypothetical protein